MIAALMLMFFREYKQLLKMHLEAENHKENCFSLTRCIQIFMHVVRGGQSPQICEFYQKHFSFNRNASKKVVSRRLHT